MAIRESLKEAGYIDICSIGDGEYILTDTDGKKEVWFANKNHASYGIIYKNTHLEFARSLPKCDLYYNSKYLPDKSEQKSELLYNNKYSEG